MLGDISGISKLYCVTGATDMRRSIDGLMAIIRDTYQMDPYANALYLFCGRRRNTLKALYFDKDGFCLLYKRLDSNGRFQWPRNASEVRPLTRQEFRWLLEGLSIDQPKAIRPIDKFVSSNHWHFFIFLYNVRFPFYFLITQPNGHLPSKTRSRLVSTVAVLGSKIPRQGPTVSNSFSRKIPIQLLFLFFEGSSPFEDFLL